MLKLNNPSFKHFLKRINPKRSWYIYVGLVIIVTLILAFAREVSAPTKDINISNDSKINLISGYDWSHMAGASQESGGVQIKPLGRAIVNQDGSDNQSNPPVNVRGPHLSVKGDFMINIKLLAIPKTGPATIYFYGQVPIIYDEWRYEPPQLKLDVYQNKIDVSEWDGTSNGPIYAKSWPTPVSTDATVAFLVKGDSLTIRRGGFQQQGMPNHGIFKSTEVWFGADAPLHTTGWQLKTLNAQALKGGQVFIETDPRLKSTDTNSQSLKTLSAANSKHLPIGAAVANYALFSDPAYRQLVSTQISLITPENEMKPQFIHPQLNTYSFTEADSLVDFALANGMKVHGHTLEFSEANPKWMQNSAPADRHEILTSHINRVVKHFGNRVNEWDVVDEPLNDNDDNNGDSSDLRSNTWFAAMGEQYIDVAFKAAHSANPQAQLYINEYGLEADGSRWDEFILLLQRLQARGVPINGVGFQAHVHESGDDVDAKTLIAHIKTLSDMGLKSRISEVDVYGDDAQYQANQYAGILQACLDSPSCTSYTMWGITDRYGSTTDIHTYPLSYGNDLIWDKNMQPKAANRALQQALKGHQN